MTGRGKAKTKNLRPGHFNEDEFGKI